MSIDKIITTVPHQKVITVVKTKTDEKNKYAKINIEAMEQAAINLEAGAFKLWVYFAKNQPGYSFALSRQAIENNFGMKKKQYTNAINELINKEYLVVSKGNHYNFNEIPENSEVSKDNHDVVSFSNQASIPKEPTQCIPKDTRNTTNITDITNNITYSTELEPVEVFEPSAQAPTSPDQTVEKSNQELINDEYERKKILFQQCINSKKEKGIDNEPIPLTLEEIQYYQFPMSNIFVNRFNKFVYNGKVFKFIK